MDIKLNTNQLKYIAIFAMLFDHIAWTFIDFNTPLATAFHFVGRITAPIMCYFIAQGYDLTSSKTKYGLRLLIFAFISQVPWIIYHGYTIYNFSLNMIFTLFICFLAVHIESSVENKIVKNLGIILLCICSIHCDWYVYAVLYSVFFYRYKNNHKKRFIAFSIVSLSYFAITLSKLAYRIRCIL